MILMFFEEELFDMFRKVVDTFIFAKRNHKLTNYNINDKQKYIPYFFIKIIKNQLFTLVHTRFLPCLHR